VIKNMKIQKIIKLQNDCYAAITAHKNPDVYFIGDDEYRNDDTGNVEKITDEKHIQEWYALVSLRDIQKIKL